MADNLQMTFQMYFLNENYCILMQSLPNFVPKITTNNKSSLAQVMAWSQAADNTLSEPMLTLSTYSYISGVNELKQ